MEFLIDPNISFVLLVSGLVLIILAMTAPGTGVIELTAIAAIVLAGIGISTMPINLWALFLLPVGLVASLLALRRKPTWAYLLVAAVTLTVGSVFLFQGEGGALAVNPVVAISTTLTALAILWFILRKALDAFAMRPTHSLERLDGMVGFARTYIHQDGTVHVNGEDWSARSADPIPVGSNVRIIGREGLVLLVEAAEKKGAKSKNKSSDND
jgi:membrane-bound serine protease (ClpP class)